MENRIDQMLCVGEGRPACSPRAGRRADLPVHEAYPEEGKEDEASSRACDLTQEAFDCSLFMRKARDLWDVFYPKESEGDTWLEEETSERADDVSKPNIASYISPALSKVPEDNPNICIPMVEGQGNHGQEAVGT